MILNPLELAGAAVLLLLGSAVLAMFLGRFQRLLVAVSFSLASAAGSTSRLLMPVSGCLAW